MSSKRKRSCNYTSQEIAKLLELVEQHRTSIEDKRTGAIYLCKKKEAWEKIGNAYNAVAKSGVRSVEQLKVLYDNKKQKARKALAEHNKNEYIKNNTVLLSHNISEAVFIDAIQHAKDDKGECSKTGGGSWCPTVSENDQKILEILKDQVTPLSNEYDSAALYFGDILNVTEDQAQTEDIILDVEPSGINENTEETKNENVNLDVVSSVIANETDIVCKFETTPTTSRNKLTQLPKKRHVVTPHTTRLSRSKCKTNYKQLYFKRKSQNAYLERRRIYQEIRLRQKEHKMLLKEHQLRVQHMEEEHKLKMKQ